MYTVAANWKMNKTISEALFFIKSLKQYENVQTIIFPPATALDRLTQTYPSVLFGSQNIHEKEYGAFTGSISASFVSDIGASYTLVGHSERRKYEKETNEQINEKIRRAISEKLHVIFCIGETIEEKKNSNTFSILEKQIIEGLIGIEYSPNISIAYEPVWAIGTGLSSTPDEAQENHYFIRSILERMYNKQQAKRCKILYGGSVTPQNINPLLKKEDINGALIGGASLDIVTFNQIQKLASSC